MSLDRFRAAQKDHWETAFAEIRSGRKRSHWMWFVFPQIAGLGRSPTARHYAIADLAEARAFLADPVLGPRLTRIAGAMLAHAGQSAEDILGPVDALKLRSSATLFRAAGGGPVFGGLLDAFHDGTPCARTLAILDATD